jgi:hypothetical protein
MSAKNATVWGLRVEVAEESISIVGLPGVKGALTAREGAYRYTTEDGQVHSGTAPQGESWDVKTALRYGLLSYRNNLNAAISQAAWPRERGTTARKSKVDELARLQAETNAMLMMLMKRFNQDQGKDQGK